MSDTVSDLTPAQLRELIETAVEQKLLEMLGDPDEGRQIGKRLRERLVRQRAATAAGERGRPLEDVARERPS